MPGYLIDMDGVIYRGSQLIQVQNDLSVICVGKVFPSSS